MKPLLSELHDDDALRLLGRASVQVVHDLKNQLNGLKLYATFLKKRLEKTEQPQELETVVKLIAGLDRMAKDVSLISQLGRPLQLNKKPGTDLEQIMREVATRLEKDIAKNTNHAKSAVVVTNAAETLTGQFDPIQIADAFKWISLGAMKLNAKAPDSPLEVQMKTDATASEMSGLIEWKVIDSSDHDPFHSLAGSNELQLSLAARVIEAHGGSASRENGALCVRLPLEQA